MKHLYGWLIIGLFGLMLILFVFPSILVALLWSEFSGESLSEARRRLSALHLFWGLRTWDIMRIFMGVRVEIFCDHPLGNVTRCIIMANHQTAVDHVMVNLVASRIGVKDLRWVLKDSMRRALVIGWVNAMMGSAFLTRAHNPLDYEHLALTARLAVQDHASMLIYPEGTRFRGEVKPGARFRHVHEPKLGGFKQLVTHLPSHRVVCVTIDWGPMENGFTLLQVGKFLGRHVRLYVYDAGFVTSHDAGDILNACWIGHERFIEEARH